MTGYRELIEVLKDGEDKAMHAKKLEEILNMGSGNTQEQTRDHIRDAIINENIPVGSTNRGFFLIDTEDELNVVIQSLEARISGVQKRIDALKNGWEQRKSSRESGGNWPK